MPGKLSRTYIHSTMFHLLLLLPRSPNRNLLEYTPKRKILGDSWVSLFQASEVRVGHKSRPGSGGTQAQRPWLQTPSQVDGFL